MTPPEEAMTMSMPGPGNGHWVRTSNPQNAKAFIREQQQRGAQARARDLYWRQLRRDIWARIRAVLRRG